MKTGPTPRILAFLLSASLTLPPVGTEGLVQTVRGEPFDSTQGRPVEPRADRAREFTLRVQAGLENKTEAGLEQTLSSRNRSSASGLEEKGLIDGLIRKRFGDEGRVTAKLRVKSSPERGRPVIDPLWMEPSLWLGLGDYFLSFYVFQETKPTGEEKYRFWISLEKTKGAFTPDEVKQAEAYAFTFRVNPLGKTETVTAPFKSRSLTKIGAEADLTPLLPTLTIGQIIEVTVEAHRVEPPTAGLEETPATGGKGKKSFPKRSPTWQEALAKVGTTKMKRNPEAALMEIVRRVANGRGVDVHFKRPLRRKVRDRAVTSRTILVFGTDNAAVADATREIQKGLGDLVQSSSMKPQVLGKIQFAYSTTGLEEKEMSRRELLKAGVGAAAMGLGVTAPLHPEKPKEVNRTLADGVEVQAARQEAVKAWKDISATPVYEGIRIRLLPVFYSAETFQAIPLVAKAGSPFLVITSSQAEEDAVRSLLDGLRIGGEQYQIWRLDLREQNLPEALAAVRKEFAHYATYPVDPKKGWLKDLLAILQEEGVIPVDDLGPALQATERYFRTLA